MSPLRGLLIFLIGALNVAASSACPLATWSTNCVQSAPPPTCMTLLPLPLEHLDDTHLGRLLLTYASHLTGVQLSKILTTLFLTTFSLPIDRLIGFGRDSASANERSTSRTQAENFACPQRTPHLHSPHLLSTCTHSTPFHLVLPSHAGKFPLIYASTYSFY